MPNGPVRSVAWSAQYARECAAHARKVKRFREARRFDALAHVLTELAETERRTILAGGQLANVAFNLAQDGARLDSRTRATIDACRKQWDAAIESRFNA